MLAALGDRPGDVVSLRREGDLVVIKVHARLTDHEARRVWDGALQVIVARPREVKDEA